MTTRTIPYVQGLPLFLFLALSAPASAQLAGNAAIVNRQAIDRSAGNAAVNGLLHDSYATDIVTDAGNAYYNPPPQVTYGVAPQPLVTDSTITFQVNALMNVPADMYVAIFGIEQVGSTADSATTAIDNRINAFLSGITSAGISRKEVHIDVVSHIPMYSFEAEQKLYSHSLNEIPIGFKIRKNVHVGFKDVDALNAMLAAAAKQEIYDIVKIDYVVDDVEGVYDSLRHATIAGVKRKVGDFEELGLDLDGARVLISEGRQATFPIERYFSYVAFGSTSIGATEAGRGTYFGAAEVNYADKPQTIYYDAIPANKYDIVINPRTVEPAVQFTYRLTITYLLKNPETTKASGGRSKAAL